MWIASFDHSDEALILVAAIGTAGTISIGLLNFFGIRKNRVFGVAAARQASVAAEKLDTGNEKDIGTYVHEIAQSAESAAAQGHENHKEILGIKASLTNAVETMHLSVAGLSAQVDSRAKELDRKLQGHLDEVDPAIQEWRKAGRPSPVPAKKKEEG